DPPGPAAKAAAWRGGPGAGKCLEWPWCVSILYSALFIGREHARPWCQRRGITRNGMRSDVIAHSRTRSHTKPGEMFLQWMVMADRPGSGRLGSGRFGLEDLGHGTAGADAGRDGSE